MFTYTPNYRPPQFSLLPKGWALLETPHDRSGFNRNDLPTSKYRFGLIGLSRKLTVEERQRYELTYVGEQEIGNA